MIFYRKLGRLNLYLLDYSWDLQSVMSWCLLENVYMCLSLQLLVGNDVTTIDTFLPPNLLTGINFLIYLFTKLYRTLYFSDLGRHLEFWYYKLIFKRFYVKLR